MISAFNKKKKKTFGFFPAWQLVSTASVPGEPGWSSTTFDDLAAEKNHIWEFDLL